MYAKSKIQKCEDSPKMLDLFAVRSIDVPDPCENWVSTPGPKRNNLESCDKIKLPIVYAYFL